jgi:hypothetical protein
MSHVTLDDVLDFIVGGYFWVIVIAFVAMGILHALMRRQDKKRRAADTKRRESHPTLAQAQTRVRSLSNAELHQIRGTKIPGSDEHVVATTELDRRNSRTTFWRKDILAWVALAVSIFALVRTFFFEVDMHAPGARLRVRSAAHDEPACVSRPLTPDGVPVRRVQVRSCLLAAQASLPVVPFVRHGFDELAGGVEVRERSAVRASLPPPTRPKTTS